MKRAWMWALATGLTMTLTVACGGTPTGDDDDDNSTTNPPTPTATQTAAPVSFATDVVPIFENTCGASVNGCHDASPYNAAVNFGCRGWLSLSNEPLGSVYNSGPNQGESTGCPDFDLYERLLDITAWTCGPTQENPNIEEKSFIVPGDSTGSYLVQRITADPNGPCALPDGPTLMPPVGSISSEDLATLVQWIDQGAPNN